ncbi:hypothetical protein ASG25_21305 [Rhizobium sp. Leaf384]|uniref:DUF4142 domain-containing protein n=1 Tax=unclassified Rhizobium TaxID=2613769 RepID=UPI000714E2C7|nr:MULTISPECIES: DUF4142 domain-containing protein [unclassified Rhizobium]KQR71582.1 hypothetical protein ASG03_03625 [Rhizobium sp. Leaf341]KQS74334.1 hypothetical protein ASG25_21305 [Rhizobium sp. Leaf384]KQS83978.1 hypothetical protein ASG58_21690 [Rhizobium sp. Leaf383]
MENNRWTTTAFALLLAIHPLSASVSMAKEQTAKPAGDAAAMMTIDRATFVPVVASANTFEIESSKLALDRASDAGIKDAAKMIIADHEKAGEKLKATLQGKDAPPPEAKLAPKHQKMIDQLQAARGKDFDTLYLDMQAQAHMEAIALFRTYAGSGDDQALVGFAKETLPSLETHMAHVKTLIAAE